TLRSASGRDACILDCGGAGPGFFFHSGETNAATVDGFTVTHGSAALGGAVYVSQASPTLVRCAFVGNTATTGGALYIDSFGSPQVTGCLFRGNAAWDGGAMAAFSAGPT